VTQIVNRESCCFSNHKDAPESNGDSPDTLLRCVPKWSRDWRSCLKEHGAILTKTTRLCATVTLSSPESHIREFFSTLYRVWGRQHWWPAQTPFEVVTGAVLTQNTAWTNVELALANLRVAGRLSLEGIRECSVSELEPLIRPAGFFRQKAERLKNFVAHVDRTYAGSLDAFLAKPTAVLRIELLGLKGIGPETADSILLYAGQHEVYVADAYARRILERHAVIAPAVGYEEIRSLVERSLTSSFARPLLSEIQKKAIANKLPGASHAPSPMSEAPRSPRAQVLNEMHALVVGVGKNFCLANRVRCEDCPLGKLLQGPPVIRELGKSPNVAK
jgi:endonuclease III related protein